MKRIALILALTSTSAMAEITPLDVIESWRTVYAGFGATITYDEIEAGPSGKVIQLTNVVSIETYRDIATTSRVDWIKMQQDIDGSILITFSPEAEQYDVDLANEPAETVFNTQFDLSALNLVATGYPGDIRYRYSAPQITLSETSEGEFSPINMELKLTDISGEATSLTEVTESGPKVVDFGEFTFGVVELYREQATLLSDSLVLQIVARNAGMNYRTEFPLTDIPAEPINFTDFPQRLDLMFEVQSGQLDGTREEDYSLGASTINFGQESGMMGMRISRNQISFAFDSQNASFGLQTPIADGPNYSLGISGIEANLSIPFRRSDSATPFSASLTLNGLALDDALWADIDAENSMGRPTANASIALSGYMRMLAGMFEGTSTLYDENAPFFIPDLSVEAFRVSTAGATIEGQGELQFNNRRMDPATNLPQAKGELDFSIIGALGFLDRFGRLSGVDPMAILGAKGGLGMFASPTETPDSFTSKVEFLSGGGVVVNGQTVR